jgi:hypothetical protein
MTQGAGKLVRSPDHELVVHLVSEFDRAMDYDRRNRARSYQNWRAYFAVEGGQWEDRLLQRLRDEDRHAATYNIIGPKVDTLAGSLASEVFDLDWKPIEGIRNSLTEAIKTSYYADKDLHNYEKSIEDVIRDAMIYRGVIKIEMSDKHNRLKNINFRRVTPGFFMADPHWVTDDDNDLEKCWEMFHLTATQVKDTYGVTNSMIDAHIQNDMRNGDQYDEYFRYSRFYNHMNHHDTTGMQRGNLHRVIEKHYIEKIKTVRIVGKILNSQRYIPFPITKDRDVLEAYMVKNKVDPLTMRPVPYEDRVHKVIAVAPSLMMEKPLEKGISTVQPKRLPYIILSANRAHGQDKGIVDDILDIQQTINKRESKLTDMINTATGGGKLVNKDLFKTPEDMKRFELKNGDPSFVAFVDGEELTKDRAIHYLNSNQFPSTLINQLERMWDIIDRVSKVPAAMDAMSQSANESGILFDRKLEVSKLGLVTIINRIKNFRKSMAECYYEQWQLAYNGPEREMTTVDGNRSVVLNKRVYSPEDGKTYIQNRPHMIPRSMVIVRESQSSPNRRMRDRAVYSELFNISREANPEYTSFFFQKLIETMDLSDEDKVELNAISVIQKFRDRQRLTTEVSTLNAQDKEAALKALQAAQAVQQLLSQGGQQALPQQQVPENEIPKSVEGGAPGAQAFDEAEFEDVGGVPGAPPAEEQALAPV